MGTSFRQVLLGIGIGLGTALQFSVSAAQQPPAPPAGQIPSGQAPAAPGRGRGGGFTEPSPMDFNDHDGYMSIFDGKTLEGWDGNPKFWRVEDGAIVGESTPANPSGNSYLAYRKLEAHDFTLKFEIKIEGSGGSGPHFRSRAGLPPLAYSPGNRTAHPRAVHR